MTPQAGDPLPALGTPGGPGMGLSPSLYHLADAIRVPPTRLVAPPPALSAWGPATTEVL
eukprot:CAMPEP_0117677338 /NCGR_PEP_ID=MMETSP0804-20121206/16692_1 /TAXON_ID=1074897 /ORGANISM="Tetraselmis astigmatica, Strain CCMP880" /LENGTH=58 /DNA_ID=CAMNT_0005486615 /DNA_START=52 /DNA_END=228 /DNA_ORIENTATION=+